MAGDIFSIKRVVTQQDTSLLENRRLWLLSWLITDQHLEKTPGLLIGGQLVVNIPLYPTSLKSCSLLQYYLELQGSDIKSEATAKLHLLFWLLIGIRQY